MDLTVVSLTADRTDGVGVVYVGDGEVDGKVWWIEAGSVVVIFVVVVVVFQSPLVGLFVDAKSDVCGLAGVDPHCGCSRRFGAAAAAVAAGTTAKGPPARSSLGALDGGGRSLRVVERVE